MKNHYFYQFVAGTRRHPAGVMNGYFLRAENARRYHSCAGYVRRVSVHPDLHINVFDGPSGANAWRPAHAWRHERP